MEQLSADKLGEVFATQESRERLMRIRAVTRLLSTCVIESKYRVPDGMHTPLAFTKYGERVADKLRRSGGVPFPESRVLCLLDMLGPEPLIDVDRTDIDALERSVHNQIKNNELRYAFIFGRELYDKFGGSFSEEKQALSTRETSELLAGTSQGVFQVDNLVTGPFGIAKAATFRSIPPTLSVPLQHCADPGCAVVHKIALSTSYDAEINEHRTKTAKILERDGLTVDAWASFFDSFATRYSRLGESHGEPLAILLGDSLTDAELRELLKWLLDNSGGALRATATSVNLRGSADKIASGLDRAQMLQLIWTVETTHLTTAVDALVAASVIRVPEGETRTAVVNRGKSFGPYGLVAEMNRLGVRMHARRSAIAPLRMRQLIEKMYNLSEESDRAELAWQLRARADESVERRLDHYLQDEHPRETMSRLVLARRSNVVVASEFLHIVLADEATDDTAFIDTVLWKLGFPVASFPDLNGQLFALYDRIMLLIRQINQASFDSLLEDLRGLCTNYFVDLERILRDCLSYSTWALTTDHYMSAEPFVYRDDRDGVPAFILLNDATADESPDHRVEYTDKPTMYALCRGFEHLAVILSGYMGEIDSCRRPDHEFPSWTRDKGGLQQFPFKHSVAFLDLSPHCQDHILETLRASTKSLVGGDVPELRNRIAHPRFSFGDMEALRASLMAAHETLLHLEADGFCRLTYTLSSFEGDSTLREKRTLSHPRGYTHALYIPSGYSWLRLPRGSAPQYVMHAAGIRGDAEVLRFTRKVYSPFADMYDGYPVRPAGASRSQIGVPSEYFS